MDDFKILTSELGTYYRNENIKILNRNSHLFGSSNPKIIECKVYKITSL